MCVAGTVVASWSLTQEAVGSNPFAVMTNIFFTEFNETFRKNSMAIAIGTSHHVNSSIEVSITHLQWNKRMPFGV